MHRTVKKATDTRETKLNAWLMHMCDMTWLIHDMTHSCISQNQNCLKIEGQLTHTHPWDPFIRMVHAYVWHGMTDSCKFHKNALMNRGAIDSCLDMRLIYMYDNINHNWRIYLTITLSCISQQVVWKSRGACLRRLSVGNSPKLNRFVLNASTFVGIYTVYTHMFVCVNKYRDFHVWNRARSLQNRTGVSKEMCVFASSSQSVIPWSSGSLYACVHVFVHTL